MAIVPFSVVAGAGGGRVVFFPAADPGDRGAVCQDDAASGFGFNTFAFLSFVLTVVNAIG